MLTKYDGKGLSYDDVGNPLSDGTWIFTWEQGRQLASMSYASNNWLFTYDANGMRTGRSNQDDVYTYIYNGSQLSRMTYGDDVMRFTYGADGSPLSINYNGTTYYYVLNLQGDVVQILNSSGAQVVYYTYDAWGRLLTTTGSMSSTLGVHNPLRYRGYVYDRETGLYYVQSRYYNPTIGRWINADGAISGVGNNILGYNLFSYCFNNPVNMSDPFGTWPSLSKIFSTVAVVAAAVAIVAVCVAAAPVAATIGGGAVLAATATTVATSSAAVAIVATVAAEKCNQHTKSYTVYTLSDPETNDVVYVGRTSDYASRMAAHRLNPARRNLTPSVLHENLSYLEARSAEHAYITHYATLNKENKANNQINGVNPKRSDYNNIMTKGFGITEALDSILTNELLITFFE